MRGIRYRVDIRTLRVRLTLWYVLLMGITLLVFSVYVYFRLQNNLIAQVDSSLQVTASQALTNLDMENARPAFQNTEEAKTTAAQLSSAGVAVQVISSEGTVWDGFGAYQSVPKWRPSGPGFVTVGEDKNSWRIYSQPIRSADGRRLIGWLQTAHSLASVEHTLEGLREQLYFALPLVLLLAALGGFFLANRALSPIDRITRTAQAITASDLNQRINYQGPADEVGRLASTLDHMLERLQQAFAQERRFTDDAAHELRTPLTVLKGRIGVTLSRQRSKSHYEQTLMELDREVDRLIHLSTALLFLSRIDQNLVARGTRPVHFSELIISIVEQMQPLAEEKGIEIESRIEQGIIVCGYEELLMRLFVNILDNAIKYTPAGGQVSVSAMPSNGEVITRVADTGVGIPEAELPHIFERFYRVASDRSRATGGAGLGLSIVDEIVRQHSGRIDVQSQVGQGTTFTIVLPACNPTENSKVSDPDWLHSHWAKGKANGHKSR